MNYKRTTNLCFVGPRDPSSSSMMSAATPSSPNFIHDFTSNSFYIPSFSAIPNSIGNSPNSMENNVIHHGGPIHSPSFLELPTMKHVSKAFHIEIWFISHSPSKSIILCSNIFYSWGYGYQFITHLNLRSLWFFIGYSTFFSRRHDII